MYPANNSVEKIATLLIKNGFFKFKSNSQTFKWLHMAGVNETFPTKINYIINQL